MKRAIFACVAALFCLAQRAEAASCSFSISTLDFLTVDTLSGAAVDRTATLTINCTNVVTGFVRICPNLGAGSGGSSGGVRYMRDASNNPLAYTLYQDTGTTLWGSVEQTLLGTPPTIDLTTTPFGSVSATRTLYGRVSANQQTAPTGSYVSNFTSSDSKISYSEAPLFNCLTLSSPVAAPFTVRADVPANCLVSTDPVDFGTHGVLSAGVDAAGAVNVRCTPGTSYSVALNGGLSNGGPTSRVMSLGGAGITYGLYKDAARSQPWGQSAGQTVAGTGTGALAALTVYGRVPAQTTPGAGTYTDTVVVTVTY